jgi:hypothetical protein
MEQVFKDAIGNILKVGDFVLIGPEIPVDRTLYPGLMMPRLVGRITTISSNFNEKKPWIGMAGINLKHGGRTPVVTTNLYKTTPAIYQQASSSSGTYQDKNNKYAFKK